MAASSFFPQGQAGQAGINPFSGGFQQQYPQAGNVRPNMPINSLFNPYGFGGVSPFVNNPSLQGNIDEVTYKDQLK